MRTVPAPSAGAPAGYALGVVRTRWNRWDQRPDLFTHGGGGYGFLSDLWWLPQLQIGIAIVTNSQDHQLQGDLALSILGDLVTEPGVYRDRLLALPSRPPVVDPNLSFEPPAGMANLVANAAMVATGDEATRWAALLRPLPSVRVGRGRPRLVRRTGSSSTRASRTSRSTRTGSLVRHRLVEVAPDLFLADNGETLDLRGPVPTWRSLRLVRVAGGPAAVAVGRPRDRRARSPPHGSSPPQSARYVAAGRARLSDQQASASRRWRRIAALAALITAVLTLGNAVLVAWMPALVDSGFLGWLDLPHGRAFGGCTCRWRWPSWPRARSLSWPRAGLVAGGRAALRLQYAVLAVAAVAVVAQLAAWRLIGWGVT